jgi:hypothetical protein
MEKSLVEKREQLVIKYHEVRKLLKLIDHDMVLRLAFEEVFSEEQPQGEPQIRPVETVLDQRIHKLREMRLSSGIGQEKASIAIGKVPSFVGRLEAGKIKRLDKPTENKLIQLYSAKKEEHKEG